MPAVSNSSPLILYSRIGRLDLLQKIFTEIIIPPAVWREVVAEGNGRPGAIEVAHTPWIKQQNVPPGETLRWLVANLDAGEAEAVALALELQIASPTLLDDRKARRIARGRGLIVSGSAGVLPLAKELGFVSEIRPLLDHLRMAGLYLTDSVTNEILSIASESTLERDENR